MNHNDVIEALDKLATIERAKNSGRFFKTGPGQYGEGDKFIGVTVPEQRIVSLSFKELPLEEAISLLHSPVHEHRLTALFILIIQYKKADDQIKKRIADLYYKNRAYINNWDLVDSSAPQIFGDYLKQHSPDVLLRLAASKSIWDRRIAILSTFASIKDGEYDLTIKISRMLLEDKEDLIHKAVGWALREVGKKDLQVLLAFLTQYSSIMPRTSLRYAIERLTPEQRHRYLHA